ncbi:MAG TPA: (2Fe-2S)-binding protein [Clostridiales bacterium]|nr:(2Fe-2S)-binding protein [Clostridiales bacterium]
MRDDNTIICRCSDVTLGEIRRLISEGYTSLDEIKRITRIGMGPCQGKTCGLLVLREIAMATGKDMRELKNHTNRPVAVGVRLDLIAKEANTNNN